jgi:hypothetical protein
MNVRRALGKILLSLVIIGIAAVAWLAWKIIHPAGGSRSYVEEIMRDIGKLAPIPRSAQNVRVGSHWFRVTASFSAPREDIQRWIDESPGLQGFTGERIDNGPRVRYGKLTGNQSVQVTVEEATDHVDVIVQGDPL